MLEFDPIANIFPMIEGQARDDFRADIEANGLQERIMLRAGRVLDGRNRYLGLIDLGLVDPDATAEYLLGDERFADFDTEHPGADPFDWVMSLNVHRRHLEPSQWAAVAANAETLKHGGSRRAATAPVAEPEAGEHPGSGLSQPQQDANLQLDRSRLSTLFNVSPRLIASAAKVRKQGAPELFDAIAQGKVKATVAEGLLSLPKKQQAEVVTGLDARRLPTVAKQVKRADTEKRLGDKVRALPTKLYGVIYADPAWRFEPYSRETGLDRAADNHYPTQETAQIKALPVGTLAAPDCVLFLWATAPMLPDALAVMRYWGFEYRSHTTWRKVDEDGNPVRGTGYWFWNCHELLLVGVRGNVPAPAPGEQWPSVIDAVPGRHSEKPESFAELVEAYYPSLPKIELNARVRREGWDAWGLEAPEDSPETASGGADARHLPASAGGEGVLGDASSSATTPKDAYTALVSASDVAKGKYTKGTAEPIVRAAYACDPVIPTKQLAADLGHPIGTVLTWANRLELTKPERRGGPDRIGQGG